MGISKSIQDAIKTITEQAVRVAPFDKTRTGIVQNVDNNTNTYSVQVDGVVYSRVKATGGIIPSIGDAVSVIFPTNNTSQMVINNIGAPNWIKGVSDLIYPVGIYYWTSDDRFDPNITFTGEWEKIDAGVTLVSAGTDYPVQLGTAKDGGEETVRLTAAESGVPAHGHGMSHTHSHSHQAISYVDGRTAAGTDRRTVLSYNYSQATGVFDTSTDATASSKSATDNNTAAQASQAHNNMPPYKAAYCWHRIA